MPQICIATGHVTELKTLYTCMEYFFSNIVYINCLFARDVAAAVLEVKNKSISLLWELNSIFTSILGEKIILF